MGISLRLILILFAILVVAIIAFDGWRRSDRRKSGHTTLADHDRELTIDFSPADRSAASISSAFATQNQPELDFDEPETEAGSGSGSGAATVNPVEETVTIIKAAPNSVTQQTSAQPPVNSHAKPQAKPQAPIDAPVIVLHLMNPAEPYQGSNMLQALLSTGCRYGDMEIFHRYTSATGQGSLQFSVASAVKPGTFDLDDLESFSTPGITLFFAAEQVEAPMASYDLLLEVIRKLEDRLGGNILDERRQALTADTINRHREVLMQYESSCRQYG